MMAKTKLFVISAPSGCGKTTLGNRLLEDGLGLANSVSMTTRPPRAGEKEGVDYYFVSDEYFRRMIRKKGFLEYEDNFGYLYGTPKKFIDDSLKKGVPILLSIDVKGAMKIKRAYPKNSVLIFIMPPSVEALKKRLHTRQSESPDSISARLSLAKKEISYKNRYDYKVVNDSLNKAYARLRKIIVGELEK